MSHQNPLSARRSFLKKIATGVGVSLLPELTEAAPSLPHWNNDEETYWYALRDQFLIEEGWIMLNAANLCPSPRAVSEALHEATRDVDRNVSYQNRDKYAEMHLTLREKLARYLNAEVGEIALTRNTSESNNTIVQGLPLTADDEVVVWDQNHPTNLLAWQIQAKRIGFTVKVVSTPPNPASPQELADPFLAAITPRTRLLGFSHISNVSGVALPAQLLCQAAREQNVLTLVDGAQSFGCHVINLEQMGCDFYTGSAHKWLMGPREVGILYARKELIESLWPHVVGLHYDEKQPDDITRLTTFGQQDIAKMPAMLETLSFHEQVGKEKIEQRVMNLTATLKKNIQEHLPQANFVTPLAENMSSGVVIIDFPSHDKKDIFEKLYRNYRIACSTKGGLRLSPNIYNSVEEMKEAVSAIKGIIS
ncbi:MAG: aminotransferase class V-fold PLP-dependent enzyme [Bacteroidota bacterium]